MTIPWLTHSNPLPPPECAQAPATQLAGLVAIGGGLSVTRLMEAYQQGIFPWFSEDQPILWWSPDPRMVLHTRDFKLHRSLRKTLAHFITDPACEIRIDHDFSAVIQSCAHTRRTGQGGTWIVEDMITAYEGLHAAGHAHSVETWVKNRLVGGLYCVSMGDTLFGESMFSLAANASKIALAALVAFARAQGLSWIDCQQNTQHLASLGAREISRTEFLELVRSATHNTSRKWVFDPVFWNTLIPPRTER